MISSCMKAIKGIKTYMDNVNVDKRCSNFSSFLCFLKRRIFIMYTNLHVINIMQNYK
jgi:hypothetical protein